MPAVRQLEALSVPAVDAALQSTADSALSTFKLVVADAGGSLPGAAAAVSVAEQALQDAIARVHARSTAELHRRVTAELNKVTAVLWDCSNTPLLATEAFVGCLEGTETAWEAFAGEVGPGAALRSHVCC